MSDESKHTDYHADNEVKFRDMLIESQIKLGGTQSVLRERERELLELKGPCSNDWCYLHYAHAGPCFEKVL